MLRPYLVVLRIVFCRYFTPRVTELFALQLIFFLGVLFSPILNCCKMRYELRDSIKCYNGRLNGVLLSLITFITVEARSNLPRN